MKIFLLCSILFCVVTLPSLGELDDADLNKIRLVVNEVVEKEISESEKRMKEYIDTKIESLDTKYESLDKRLSLVTVLICGLIALIVVAVGLPQIIIAWRSTKDSTREKNVYEAKPEITIIRETPTQ